MARSRQKASVPAVRYVIAETWTNLTGRVVTMEEVLGELARLPREAFTRSVLQLLALLPPGDIETAIETEVRLRERYFPPELQPLLRGLNAPDAEAQSMLFHRRQLLAAFLLGQGSCPEGDGVVPWIILGPLLLKVSALLVEEVDLKAGHPLGMAAYLLPHFYDSNPAHPHLGLLRGAALAPLTAWARQTKLAHAKALFESTTGLPLTDFYKVLIPLHHRLSTISDPESTPLIRPQSMFETAPQGQAIKRTLDLLSVPYADYPHRVPSPPEIVRRRTHDIVRSQPLLRLPNGGYACVDPAALGERSAANLHWTLRKLLPAGDGQEYLAAWGALVEEYVNVNLGALLGADYRANPADSHGREITDGLLDAGDDVVLVEVKTATLNDDKVRYANDPGALAASIEAKFFGASQLGTAMELLFGPAQLGREFCKHLRQQPPRPVRHAWPVMVVTDRALCLPQLEHHVGERLSSSLPSSLPGSLRVMPLQVLFIDDVQRLFPLLRRRHKLVNLLRERGGQARPWRTTFHNFLIAVYDRAGVTHPFEMNEVESVFGAGTDFWRAQGADLTW